MFIFVHLWGEGATYHIVLLGFMEGVGVGNAIGRSVWLQNDQIGEFWFGGFGS